MNSTPDSKVYAKRAYHLRMIGGPYDNVQVTEALEEAPRSYHWAGLPSEYSPWRNAARYFTAKDEIPQPMDTVVRVDYFLEGVYETGYGSRIAIYVWGDPSVQRRHTVIDRAEAAR